MATSLTPRGHVEKIRKEIFFIGRKEKNPLAGFLHQAVGYLSEELYTKDSHFIFELIQNAQDNEYGEDVVPSLEFVVTDRDLTGTGAPATLLLFNNERGFSPANIKSICGVEQSMKKGNRQRGYIGEKGIGFKSVFLVCSQPHIFSGGYQIKFDEKPSPECNIGYIVPEWVESKPSLNDLQQVYGASKTLPTTTIVLPLKPDKVKTVKDQLSHIHPEILLFMSKIRGLSVREEISDSKLNTVRAVSIASETNFQQRKNIDAESYTLSLECQEDGCGPTQMCSYYMWRQKFPVKPENRVERRKEVEEWNITLAFPHGQSLHRGMKMPGIYAFLPTGMITNFPFIIQADFILVSSRESILMDNLWNVGILNCVAPAFKNALVALVKSNAEVPLSSLPAMFKFLPVDGSNFPVLETARQSIKNLLAAEHIVPCESYTEQRIFCKGGEVARLKPEFWDILIEARKVGVNLQNLSSHGTHILASAFDESRYDSVLEFLGVGYVSNEWYGKCIESSNLAAVVPWKVYLDLLLFVAHNWESFVHASGIRNIPLLELSIAKDHTTLWSVNRATEFSDRLCLASDLNNIPWLLKWQAEFGSACKHFFFPKAMHAALNCYHHSSTIRSWFSTNIHVRTTTVYEHCNSLLNAVKSNRKHLIAFTHFVHRSFKEKYLSEWDVKRLCESLPLVDSYGSVVSKHDEVLVPAIGSKWVGLVGSNPWRAGNYVELSQDYTRSDSFAGIHMPEDALLQFLCSHVGAADVPEIRPPNASFPTVSSLLTKTNAFLLLDWIRSLKRRDIHIPERFLGCVKHGMWLKTSMGSKAPEEAFLSDAEWGNLLQLGPLVDIPLITQEYYDNRIRDYKDELKLLGVMSEFGEACRFIGKRFTSMSITRSNAVAMLSFIKLLRQRYMPTDDFVSVIKKESWLKCSNGYVSPVGAILYDSEWASAAALCELPFIDADYYGQDIVSFKSELAMLDVVVAFDYRLHSQRVINNLRTSISFGSLSADAHIFMLECIRNASSAAVLVDRLKMHKWVVTRSGLMCPEKSVLFDPEWECLFTVVDSLPVVDEEFYGVRIRSFEEELRRVGVLVGVEGAMQSLTRELKKLMPCSLSKEKVLALLACYHYLSDKKQPLEIGFANFLRREAWLQTKLDRKSPSGSILFHSEWDQISLVASLPFVDDGEACYGEQIHAYKLELAALGVTVEFKKGLKFIMDGLSIPSDPSMITSGSVVSILKCIQILRQEKLALPDKFRSGLRKKWLKTSMGYRSPDDCALFGPAWTDYLEQNDAPFIDEVFYGTEIMSYRDDLKEIGVIVNPADGNTLVVDHLKVHSDFTAITRIYLYLKDHKWKAGEKHVSLIWIPDGNLSGEWVDSGSCVLHDKNDLFCSKLHILDKYYDSGLINFFQASFGVKRNPTLSHYLEVWNEWESSNEQLTESQCRAVWVYLVKNCTSSTLQSHELKLTKLPVISSSGIITLAKLQDVFIPDDLLLKDLFDRASDEGLFVWHPQPTLPFLSMTEFFKLYTDLGVRGISVAVEKEVSMPDRASSRKIHADDKLFKNGLFRIILGFLADPSPGMGAEKRHGLVKCLLDATILETDEPTYVDCRLGLSSGKILTVKASRIFSWDREACKFYVHGYDTNSCKKASIEFATYFAEVVSEGLLWEETEQIPRLAELIRLGSLLDFDEDAVGFLLKSRNLQLLMEDEEFLSSALSARK